MRNVDSTKGTDFEKARGRKKINAFDVIVHIRRHIVRNEGRIKNFKPKWAPWRQNSWRLPSKERRIKKFKR